MFFLPSSFRLCPPLKNDGRGDVFFNGITFLPVILERSEESGQRIQVLNTLFSISLAGFFAKSQIMFFLLSSFRFCPPLKNDGRGDVFFNGITFLPVILERSEESGQRIQVLIYFLRLTLDGFFAKSHIIFFSSIIIPIMSTAQE